MDNSIFAVHAFVAGLVAIILVSYTVLLHVTRPGKDPSWLIWLRYLLLIVLLVLASLFLWLSWKTPQLAQDAPGWLSQSAWLALSHGMIGLSFLSTQLLSIGYAIRRLHRTHATFSYTATGIAFSLLVGYLIPASLRADTDGPPGWIWGALGVVPCAASFFFGHAFPMQSTKKAHLLAVTALNAICFGVSVFLTIPTALERLNQPFVFQCIPPMITITSQIVLRWGDDAWKLFKTVGARVQLLFSKDSSGECAPDANPETPQNTEGHGSRLAEASSRSSSDRAVSGASAYEMV